jgi:hypothetical protein
MKVSVVSTLYVRETEERSLHTHYSFYIVIHNGKEIVRRTVRNRPVHMYRTATYSLPEFSPALRHSFLPFRNFKISTTYYPYVYGFEFIFFKILPYISTRIFSLLRENLCARPSCFLLLCCCCCLLLACFSSKITRRGEAAAVFFLPPARSSSFRGAGASGTQRKHWY